MKKKVFITTTLLIISFLIYQTYVFFLAPSNNLNGIYLVPKDAVLVIETQKPIDNWSDISSSDIWKHLQKNNYFNELTKSLNGFDNVFTKQKKLIDFIGNRSMFISIHVTQKKKYDLLFIADLQKIAKLNLLKTHLSSFVSDSFKLNKRKYHNYEILEFYAKKSRETLYISFIENQLIASYTHSLVEQAIDQFSEPVIGRDLQFIDINKKVGFDNMFRLYVQYKHMNSYLNCFFDDSDSLIKDINKTFNYSGFHFDLKSNNVIVADGYTNTLNNANIYLQALQKSGYSKHTISKIAPKRTAFYLSFAFENFTEFYKNFETVQSKNPTDFKVYQDNLDKIENYLDIDIKTNFISWLDNEMAIIQMQSINKSIKNEMALVFKIKSKKKAEENLKYILKRIKKKTPVKFKEITYKKHTIQFMSIKGFFKVLLGSIFNEIDKPYFTIINDYIVFSNHPNTLKNIIDDYVGKETLNKSEDFQDFKNYFDSKSSVFAYINTPVLYKNIYSLADKKTKKQLINNKDFIICFPQVGFQLTPYINMFESKLVVSYQDVDVVKSKEQFKDKLEGPKLLDTSNLNNDNNENLLILDKVDLFKTPKIRPNDLDTSEYISKYDNGSIKLKVSIENGVPNGRFKEYYKNGTVKLKGRFKNGKKHKTWKAYDNDGNLLKKKKF